MTVFTTTYLEDGIRYCGKVCAISWEEAQAICDKRRPGEQVDGELIQEIDVDDPIFFGPQEPEDPAEDWKKPNAH